MTEIVEKSGFPPGYFVIRSAACQRVLDVSNDQVDDGVEIVLWPEKEKSLVETFRDADSNNQVFFLDSSGALCSRSSGHAIDVEGGSLVLRHRRPISYPYPNKYAHPLPKFTYSANSGEITVHFGCDPAYPLPGAESDAWKSRRYVLSSIPMRQPRSIIDDASEFLTRNIFSPLSMLGGGQAPAQSKPDEVFDGRIELQEEDIVEEERGEEGEVDDSVELLRRVKVVTVGKKDSQRAKKRRTWVVLPLRKTTARTGGI
ncbi:hypothetical protein FA15DRAFT_667165 [Coprinopsis marcescibilis]|uniref:Ricin B lectin domain-containing protein n=1 Tax=Coprinopsis marcescibilis TaxID=230819 RepID=A0A5C3LE24_COPMA|nr:hypothetical protein FA15DRAFT_667165 [Coprinopsis marcescibilis]